MVRNSWRSVASLKGAALVDRRDVLVASPWAFLSPRVVPAPSQPSGFRGSACFAPTPTNPVDRAIVDAFLAGLQEAGYEQGKKVRVEIRYALVS
jgi:hypothetical protein